MWALVAPTPRSWLLAVKERGRYFFALKGFCIPNPETPFREIFPEKNSVKLHLNIKEAWAQGQQPKYPHLNKNRAVTYSSSFFFLLHLTKLGQGLNH